MNACTAAKTGRALRPTQVESIREMEKGEREKARKKTLREVHMWVISVPWCMITFFHNPDVSHVARAMSLQICVEGFVKVSPMCYCMEETATKRSHHWEGIHKPLTTLSLVVLHTFNSQWGHPKLSVNQVLHCLSMIIILPSLGINGVLSQKLCPTKDT